MTLTEAPVVEAPPSAQSAEGVDRVCTKGHAGFEPDSCFACKAHYWRINGMQTRIPAEWGTGPTMREIRDDIYAEARRTGTDIRNTSRAELI